MASVLATTGELARVAGPGLRTHIGDVLPPHHRRHPGQRRRQQAPDRSFHARAGARALPAAVPGLPNHSQQPQLRALLLRMLNGRSSLQGALTSMLRWLWQVVESTGMVMAPYLEYPQLLAVLLRMLNEGEGSPHIRREVLKVAHSVTSPAAHACPRMPCCPVRHTQGAPPQGEADHDTAARLLLKPCPPPGMLVMRAVLEPRASHDLLSIEAGRLHRAGRAVSPPEQITCRCWASSVDPHMHKDC